MKSSQVNIIVANMFIAGSFLTNHIWNSLLMLCLGIVWLGGAIMTMKTEVALERLDRRAKHMMLLQGFDLVENLLKQMPNEKPKRRKKR